MAAISLKDLISGQQELASKEKPASMSIAELRKLMAEEVTNSKAQLAVQKDIKTTATKDRTIQLAQTLIAAKTDKDLNKDEAEALKIAKELLENNKKMFKELQKHSKILATTTTAEKNKKITDKSMGLEQFKTLRERSDDMKKGFKEFFTLKGFLNKTGLIDKSSTGVIATAVNKRAAKQQYIQDRMRVNPGLKNLKQYGGDEKKAIASLGKQFEEQQKVRSSMRTTEKDIAGLEKRGFTEEQIAGTDLFKKREQHAAAMSKVDTRVRGEEKQTKKTATKEKKKVGAEAADFSDEASIEASRQVEQQINLLSKIEENTRPAHTAASTAKSEEKKDSGMLSGVVDFITNMLGEGLISSIKSIFSPKNILKSLGKAFAIGAIIGALYEGLMDGFDEFMKTGDIGKAIVAGLTGIVDFLTFGLFDKEKIKEVIGDMATWLNDHIVKPVTEFFTSMKDGFMSILSSIKIPAIVVPLPKVLGGDITLGPWSPFGDSKAAASAPAPSDANAVYGKSSENADKAADNKSSAPVIVNAPSTVNQSSSQNVSIPAPIRNTDTGLSAYIRKNTSFI